MNKIRSISIGVSLFIHTSVIGLMGGGGWIQRWIPVIPPPKSTEVALQFVDSPPSEEEVVPEAELEEESRVVSDKTVAAKDIEEEMREALGETKSKEISEGKQLAKLSQGMPKPAPQIPRPQETMEGITPIASLPDEAIQDTSGDDIVSLPEISEDILSTPEKGAVTFEAQYHKIGPYFKEIKREIEGYWLGYLIFKYPNTAPIESETTVSFKILPTGEVTGLEVVEYNGDVIFRDFCVATISNTAPYPPLPEGIDEVEEEGGLGIVFTFRYR